MISIIVCATDSQAVEALKKNVEDTIECPYEILSFDNTTHGWGLCKVYNHMAQQAKMGVLCFVHQDVKFQTKGWGKTLVDKVLEPKTGVVGVAGSAYKSQTPSGWVSLKKYSHSSLHEQGQHICVGMQEGEYHRVITLDGVFLCTSTDRWRQMPFDEHTFDDFHLYDLDFSMTMAQAGYHNYVSAEIGLEHFSRGKFADQWWKECQKFHQKWHDKLPLFVGVELDARQVRNLERTISRNMTYLLLKNKIGERTFRKERLMHTVNDSPLNLNNLELTFLYIK